jgi:hypothetical protein
VVEAQLVGPVLFRYLFGDGRLDRAFVASVVDLFLRGASPTADGEQPQGRRQR